MFPRWTEHQFEPQIEYTLVKKNRPECVDFLHITLFPPKPPGRLYCKTVDGLKSFTIKWFWKYGNRCCVCFPCVFFKASHQQISSGMIPTSGCGNVNQRFKLKNSWKVPKPTCKILNPCQFCCWPADLWGWWNGDPGKLISLAGWKMDVWRMYFPWGCFGPLVVLVYRSVPDLLFKLITWPFVKTKKNLQIRFTIEKKNSTFRQSFCDFLGGWSLYHSTICPGVLGTSISCGLKEDVVMQVWRSHYGLGFATLRCRWEKWSQKSSDPNGG